MALADDFSNCVCQKTIVGPLLLRRFGHLLIVYLLDPRQKLNNFLQSKGTINDLQWDTTRQGPSHCPVWYAICLGSSSRAVCWAVLNLCS